MNIQKEDFLLASDLIKKSKNILLIPHAKMDCDGMSAAISLYKILKEMGKNPTAVCQDPVPEVFSFLPSTEVFDKDVVSHASNKQSFSMTLDTNNAKFSNLEYTIEEGRVNITFFSEGGKFTPEDFSFLGDTMKPDLIITLDSGDIQQLGGIYEENIALFDSLPVLNIDHHISNTHFGTLNLVEMKSSSTTEIVYDLLPYLDERGHSLITPDIATLLLAGLITDTGSFQHSNTTPKALDTAAELIELGARQQEIIKHLFKTKSLSTLRLWGKVLTKLQNDPLYRMVWSSVSSNDLQETFAHSEDAEGLIDELLSTTPGTEMVVLVKEREDGLISTSVRTSSSFVDATIFAEKFGGGGHRQAAGFKIRERGGKSFEEIVADIIFEAKKFQSDRLGVNAPIGNISYLSNNLKDIPQPKTDEMKATEMKKNTDNVAGFPDMSEALAMSSFAEPKRVSNPPIVEKPSEKKGMPKEETIQNVILKKEEVQDMKNDQDSSVSQISDDKNFQKNNSFVPNTSQDTLENLDKNSINISTEESSRKKENTSVQTVGNTSESFPDTAKTEQKNPISIEKSPHFSQGGNNEPLFLSDIDYEENEKKNKKNLEGSSLHSSIKEETDEFALFLENAKEKEEDEKFDTSFSHKTTVSSEQQKKTEGDEFDDDFLQALREENPRLSPIVHPSPEEKVISKTDDESLQAIDPQSFLDKESILDFLPNKNL